MWMELQGKKTTHDFLSLYKDLSFQHPDLRPPSQGFYLKTNDFLQQLERAGKNSTTKAATTTNDLNVISATAGTEKTVSVEHVLPGGIGTYSISHVPAGYVSRAVVKPEWATWGELPPGSDAERNSETNGVVVGNTSRDCNSYTGVGFTLWEEPQTSRDKRSRGPQQHWPSAFAAPSSHSSFASLSSSKRHPVQEKLRFMDAAASKSNKGFADDDEDDESDFGKRDEPSRRELSVRVDRKSTGSGSDQKATTPRSKHSATEQRRRSKINDRFQILRDLIPHSDQKRDKASFLLEVIEYIQFLQEKVQKYESSYPGWNQDNAKLTPWKNSQGTGESLLDHSQVIKNGPAQAGFVFSGDNTIPGTTMLANTQSLVECDNTNAGLASKVGPMPVPVQQYVSVGKGGGLVQPHPRLVSDSENTASQSQAQWPTDCTITSSMLNEQEELTVEDGTISVSSVYSQGLLTALTQSLQNSGIDLSQSTISVQINLGKRAINRPTCSAKDHDDDDPLSSNHLAARDSRAGSSGEESEEPAAKKRRKSDKKKS